MHKSNVNKLQMMTKENFLRDKKLSDSDSKESQRTLKQPQSPDHNSRTPHKLMRLKPFASQHLGKLNEGSVQEKPDYS